ncbi:MAG: Mov34/MPN/PAD-1 family protein [Candidatus Helarchaeota archaeon]
MAKDKEKKESKEEEKKEVQERIPISDAKKPTKVKEPGIVRISLDAYKTIVLHATRFANSKVPIDNWKEIYGFLIGKVEGEDVIVENAVPMAHGSSVEVEFTDEHYVRSATIDSMAAERGLFIVGWYHSHPGLSLFLSSTDIKNHLAYQQPNPKSVALVFDHTLVGKKSDKENEEFHPGFRIFKLDDPNLGTMSDFHEIEYEIEKPTELSFAQTLASLSEKATARSPLMPEYGEESSVMDSFGGGGSSGPTIDTSPLGEIKITVPPLDLDLVSDGLVNAFRSMIQEVLPPMFASFSEQTNQIAAAFQDLANRQVKAMNDLAELMSIGIGEVRSQIIDKIDESHEGLINVMSTNFSSMNDNLNKATDDLSDMEDRILDDVNKVEGTIKEKFGVFNSEIEDMLGKELDTIKDDVNSVEKEVVDRVNLHIDGSIDELIKVIELKIEDKMKDAVSKLKAYIDEKFK